MHEGVVVVSKIHTTSFDGIEDLYARKSISSTYGIGVLVIGLVGAVFVFMLAINVYGPGLGIVLGILSLIPCIGLIVLLVVNGKATAILKQNGIKVGLLGAKVSEF